MLTYFDSVGLAQKTLCSLGKLNSFAWLQVTLEHRSSFCCSSVLFLFSLPPHGCLPPELIVRCLTGISTHKRHHNPIRQVLSCPHLQMNWVSQRLRNFLKLTVSKWGTKKQISAHLIQILKGRIFALALLALGPSHSNLRYTLHPLLLSFRYCYRV